MADHEPTIHDDPDQEGEGLDDDKLPEQFPDRPVASRAYGITEAEQAHGEGLQRKLAREEPDVTFDDEDEDEEGFDDEQDAEEDDEEYPEVLGDYDEEGDDEVGELVASRAEENEDDYFGDHGERSPEETAMHVVDDVPGSTDRHAVRDEDARRPRRRRRG